MAWGGLSWRSKDLTVVLLKMQMLWDVTSCCWTSPDVSDDPGAVMLKVKSTGIFDPAVEGTMILRSRAVPGLSIRHNTMRRLD